ncbi:hypothetical protein D5086_012540 [Populus alba]|uniref:Uncharacterized protein n=1 Tax=Populus alba TaxID=43335 RepID=A0ACC4C300_POPAL
MNAAVQWPAVMNNVKCERSCDWKKRAFTNSPCSKSFEEEKRKSLGQEGNVAVSINWAWFHHAAQLLVKFTFISERKT